MLIFIPWFPKTPKPRKFENDMRIVQTLLGHEYSDELPELLAINVTAPESLLDLGRK